MSAQPRYRLEKSQDKFGGWELFDRQNPQDRSDVIRSFTVTDQGVWFESFVLGLDGSEIDTSFVIARDQIEVGANPS